MKDMGVASPRRGTDAPTGTAERKKMKIDSTDFRVQEGDKVNLNKWPTKVDPVYKSKEQYQKFLEEHVAQLSFQQQLLYASNRHAVLQIFQAMDAAGKDGAIRHVMSGVGACRETSRGGTMPTALVVPAKEGCGEKIRNIRSH
jgi:polyphosphate kinase 2 (PPK2 family)